MWLVRKKKPMEPNQPPNQISCKSSHPSDFPIDEEIAGVEVPCKPNIQKLVKAEKASVGPGFAAYEVQFELPVNNPLMNVSKRKHKRGTTFYVPINHPRAHVMGYMELVEAAALSGLVRVTHNP